MCAAQQWRGLNIQSPSSVLVLSKVRLAWGRPHGQTLAHVLSIEESRAQDYLQEWCTGRKIVLSLCKGDVVRATDRIRLSLIVRNRLIGLEHSPLHPVVRRIWVDIEELSCIQGNQHKPDNTFFVRSLHFT